jgi:nucleoid-associated protein YgaU
MSPAKRVILGVGIMLLGALAALPFRRDAAPEPALVADASDNVLSLSQGVSLQMPGQQATVPLPARPNPPSPAEVPEEASQEDQTERSVQADVAALAKPPALPDQYRPLFKPMSVDDRSGHVATPPAAPARPARRHTIHDGDTLESLAVRYLGDSQRASEILELNRQVLSDPQLLPIGVSILIPPRDPDNGTAASPAEGSDLVPLPTNRTPWNQ